MIKGTNVHIGTDTLLVCANNEQIMHEPSLFGSPVATLNVQISFLCLQCLRWT